MKNKVIATSWHPGGANAIIPVIKRLQNDIKVEVIGHGFSEGVFKRAGIDYKTIGDYHINNISTNSMIQIVEKIHPQLVLTGSSIQDKDNRNVIEQTIALAARKKKIKSLSVMDWWGNLWEKFSDLYDENGRFREEIYGKLLPPEYTEKDGKFKFLPDKIGVMDSSIKMAMLEEGFDENRLVITGNPFFDELIILKEGFRDREKVRNDLKIDPKSYVIFYASQNLEYVFGDRLGYTEKTVLRELLKSIKDIPGKKISVLVKVHPREDKKDIENLERIVKEEEFNDLSVIIVDKDYNTRTAIMASDVAVAASSTTLIESTYLGLPSISLQPGLKAEDYLEATNKSGITIPIYKEGEIREVLRKLIFDERYKLKLATKRKEFQIDGKATERVTNLVHKILDKSN